MISECTFCGDGLAHRLPFGNADGTLLVILPVDEEVHEEVWTGLFPEAYFMWRASCREADETQAKLGCAIFIRWMIGKFAVVAVERSDVKVFFGSSVGEDATIKLPSGKVVIPYDKIDTLWKEVQRINGK